MLATAPVAQPVARSAVSISDMPFAIEEIMAAAILARNELLAIANRRLQSGKAAGSFANPLFNSAFHVYMSHLESLFELLINDEDDVRASAHRGIEEVLCMNISPDPTTCRGEVMSRLAHYR